MDEKYLELASEREEEARAVAIARAGAQVAETHPDFDGVHCVRCDEEIPTQRLAMGKVRCTDCQSFLERNRGRI